MPIKTGSTITHGANEYIVRELINSGGFGDAYRAERIKPSPAEVVVKVPTLTVANDPIWSKKFEREARILANIDHPNVVKIVAFWKFKDGQNALVQEMVTGAQELPKYIASRPDAAPSLFLQTLYGLRAFHDQANPSAVHRDISPRNILVSDSGIVKIIDFGLAKEDPRATAVLTQTGERFGTPGCMSPEQLTDAASVDHRTDLFALGRSFAGALQQRHPGAANCAKLPEPWRTLCLRLTEHDENDRPPSAAVALAEAMAEFAAAGVPIENFPFHIAEMRSTPVSSGWSALCQSHFFRFTDFDQSDIQLLKKLGKDAFLPPFDANAFLDLLEDSTALAEFDSGDVTFDDADPLGVLYAALYPSLGATHKLVCFQRLCSTAVRLHRYSVMSDVRMVYGSETNPAIQAQLRAILDEKDGPPHTIHGRGIIPGRAP
jgi:serine/threonine protein kinase